MKNQHLKTSFEPHALEPAELKATRAIESGRPVPWLARRATNQTMVIVAAVSVALTLLLK